MHLDQTDFCRFLQTREGQVVIEAAQGIYFPCVYISLS